MTKLSAVSELASSSCAICASRNPDIPRMFPLSAPNDPSSMAKKLDLPVPFAPMSASFCPGCKVADAFCIKSLGPRLRLMSSKIITEKDTVFRLSTRCTKYTYLSKRPLPMIDEHQGLETPCTHCIWVSGCGGSISQQTRAKMLTRPSFAHEFHALLRPLPRKAANTCWVFCLTNRDHRVRIQNLRLRTQGSGLRAQGSGLRANGKIELWELRLITSL